MLLACVESLAQAFDHAGVSDDREPIAVLNDFVAGRNEGMLIAVNERHQDNLQKNIMKRAPNTNGKESATGRDKAPAPPAGPRPRSAGRSPSAGECGAAACR